MLSRQESSLSSSRRQLAAATPPPETHHAKAIGCMSGIFQLFSKYYYPNKRITSGRKQEKISKAKPKPKDEVEKPEKQIVDTRKVLTCETKIPRSPTLPPEIRSESPRTPSSLVARLMGLEEIGAKKPGVVVKDNDQDDDYGIVERRRRQLMQALEKCNEDLEDLKRIIQAVQTADVRLKTPRVVAEDRKVEVEKKKGTTTDEEMSPVCVLDEVRSPRVRDIKVSDIAAPVLENNPTSAEKPQENEEPITKNIFFTKYSTVTEASLIRMRRQAMASPPQSTSRRAMAETIEQVCRDIAWGEKREVEKIGLVLQDNLFKDMVEEVVQELKCCGNSSYSLPLERCKKRLSFQ